MRRRSKKKEAEYVIRRKIVERLLSERPYCEACPKFAKHDGKLTYVRRGSQGGSILEEENLLAVCRACHDRIGRSPQLAFDLGLAKHGWENKK
jgi:hypothetical protein